jgi:hypothetical protein
MNNNNKVSVVFICMGNINLETDPSERGVKAHNLLKYCELDTYAMVDTAGFFTSQ